MDLSEIVLGFESIKIFAQSLSGRGYKRYKGDPIDICRQVVIDRWNGKYFSSGPSRLNQFWIRDFAWCLDGLIYLGLLKDIRTTLNWVLGVYQQNGGVTTTIFGNKVTLDIFYFSADSLPMLLYALKRSQNLDLVKEHKDFLNKEVEKYFRNVFDQNTNLVKSDRYFSTPKDVMERKLTCVSNTFMIFLNELLLDIPSLDNPFKNIDLRSPFIKAFWTGRYFRNDLEDSLVFISSDANIWPYWTGIIRDKKMAKASVDAIKSEKLDQPFPIKYQSFLKKEWMHPTARLFIPNYQGDSIWTLHGPIYIELEYQFYPKVAKEHLLKYLNLIKQYGTYAEVFEPDGSTPLRGRLGFGSEIGMLWAAMIPLLMHKLT